MLNNKKHYISTASSDIIYSSSNNLGCIWGQVFILDRWPRCNFKIWLDLLEINIPERIITSTFGEMRARISFLIRRARRSFKRAMLMELLYRFCQITQPETGKLVGGIDYSAVSQARKRFKDRMSREPKLKKEFTKLGDRLLQLSRVKT